ncbi:MAG: oligosaccharide flippase family protein [Nibricoccus sp.]
MQRLLPILLSQAMGLACGVIGIRLTSHWIAPADYGNYGIFLSFTPLGMWVVHSGLIKYVGRHWADASSRPAILRMAASQMIKKLPWLMAATGIVSFASSADLHGLRLWPVLFVASALLSGASVAQTALQAASEHWKDFAVSSVGSLSRSFVPPLLYVIAGGSLLTLEAGFCFHAIVLCAAGVWCIRSYFRAGISDTTLPSASVYQGPLFVTLAIAGWAAGAMNRWIVAAFFGSAAAGYFTLASNIAVIVTGMLGVVFVQYFQPGIFAKAGNAATSREDLVRHVDHIAGLYWITALLGIVLLHYSTPWLVGRLIGANYEPALDYILGAGCFGIAMFTGQFFHTLLLAGHRERACGPVDLAAFAVMICGGLISAWLGGEIFFLRWLLVTPLIPWLINRSMARRYFFKPAL